MSDGVSMTVRNKDRLFRKLKKLAPGMEDALVTANGKAAEDMASLARSFAPVHTGKLRESIVVTPPGGATPPFGQGAGPNVPEGAYAVTAGNSQVRYAHLVEYGTAAHDNAGMFKGTHNPGARRQPFFWPAYRLIRKSMRSRATRAINKAVKAVTT